MILELALARSSEAEGFKGSKSDTVTVVDVCNLQVIKKVIPRLRRCLNSLQLF